MDSVPTGSGDTPVVGGVLVTVDANLSSLHFFVSIDTHGVYFFVVYISECQRVIALFPITNAWQRYEHILNWPNNFFGNDPKILLYFDVSACSIASCMYFYVLCQLGCQFWLVLIPSVAIQYPFPRGLV